MHRQSPLVMHDDVAIFWDYENCHASASVSGYDLVKNIRRVAHTYGTVSLFKAYLELSNQVSSDRMLNLRSELQSSGVSLTDCPHNGKKNVADQMIIVDMLTFAIDRPAPATIILISGDRDFAYAVSVLRLRRYQVIVISMTNPGPHASLRAQASDCLNWNDHIIGGLEPASSSPQPGQYTPRLPKACQPLPTTQPAQPLKSPPLLPSKISILPKASCSSSELPGISNKDTHPKTDDVGSKNNLVGIVEELLQPRASHGFDLPLQASHHPPRPNAEPADRQTAPIPLGCTIPDVGQNSSASTAAHSPAVCSLVVIGSSPEPSESGDVGGSPVAEDELLPSLGSVMHECQLDQLERGEPPSSSRLTADNCEFIPLSMGSVQTGVAETGVINTGISGTVSVEENPKMNDHTPQSKAQPSTIPKAGHESAVKAPVQRAVPLVSPSPPRSPPPKDPPLKFRVLVDVLRSHKDEFPARSKIEAAVLATDPLAPVKANVGSYAQYAGLAESMAIVQMGRSGDHLWISLREEYKKPPNASMTNMAGPCGPGAASPKKNVGAEKTISSLPRHFRILVEILRAKHLKGMDRPLRSEIACLLLQVDPNIYKQASFTKFKQFVGKAEEEGLVILGGCSGSDWVSLQSKWRAA